MGSDFIRVKGFSALDQLRELVNVIKVKIVKLVAKKVNDESFFVAVVNGDALSKNVSLVRTTCNLAFRDVIRVSSPFDIFHADFFDFYLCINDSHDFVDLFFVKV